eukprot:370673_1
MFHATTVMLSVMLQLWFANHSYLHAYWINKKSSLSCPQHFDQYIFILPMIVHAIIELILCNKYTDNRSLMMVKVLNGQVIELDTSISTYCVKAMRYNAKIVK